MLNGMSNLGERGPHPARMFDSTWRRLALAIALGAGWTGCGSSDPPGPQETAPHSETSRSEPKTPVANGRPAAGSESDATPADTLDSKSVSVTQPAAEPVSPEQQEAQSAFETMTADGVSQEDLETSTVKLLGLGEAAIPVLAKGLQAEDALEREMAATILAQFGPDAAGAKTELIAALKDESNFVRANAATALAQMDGQSEHVVPVFGGFLESDDEHLRRMAAMNLAVLEISAVKPLVEKLSNVLSVDDPAMQVAIVELLGRMGPDAAAAVEDIKALDTADKPELQTAVTAALMQIEPEEE